MVANPDLLMTPGAFARVRLPYSAPTAALLVPDSAVLADQSERMVLTLGKDNTVVPKHVQVGDLRDGLRVIRSGLLPTDKVIIEGIPWLRRARRWRRRTARSNWCQAKAKAELNHETHSFFH